MLYLPEQSLPLRILGIDPGTNTLGVAVIDLDLATQQMTAILGKTFSGNQLAGNFNYLAEVYGDRAARLRGHEDNLYYFMHEVQPHCIIAESPYMGRFPQAFSALVECVNSIYRAVLRYNRTMPLLMIDPPSVKKAAGMVGRLAGKEPVRIAMSKLPHLHYAPGFTLDSLDEHGVDALAVAHYRAGEIIRSL